MPKHRVPSAARVGAPAVGNRSASVLVAPLVQRTLHIRHGQLLRVLGRCAICRRDYWLQNLSPRTPSRRRFGHECLTYHTGFVEPVRMPCGDWLLRRTSGDDGNHRVTRWDVEYVGGGIR